MITDKSTNHAFVTDHFAGSQHCSTCHDGIRDASGADVSIVVDWQATMMANSARDPLWRAKVASDVITNAGQVQSYETIMQNIAGDLTYTLMEAATYRKDNRLLPAGMDKSSVPSTIEPRGDAMADTDFIGGSDQVHYQISGLQTGTYTVAASLNYQTMAYSYGQDLFSDVDEPRVALFKDLDGDARLRFETISSDTGSIDF